VEIAIVRKAKASWGVLQALAALWVIVVLILSFVPYYAVDFRDYFLPAARLAIRGEDPYSIEGFYNPPWMLLFVLPFSWLPDQTAQNAYIATALIVMAYALRKIGASTVDGILAMVSVPFVSIITFGNVEWLILFGAILPPWLGVFFVMMKPQIGLGVFIYWAIEAYTRDKERGLVRLLIPLMTVTIISFLLFGFWPIHMLGATDRANDFGINTATFPWMVPIGFLLLDKAWRSKKAHNGLVVAPCWSPYLMGASWFGAFVALIGNTKLLLLAVFLSWIGMYVKGMVL
jgi:hypothetical protein